MHIEITDEEYEYIFKVIDSKIKREVIKEIPDLNQKQWNAIYDLKNDLEMNQYEGELWYLTNENILLLHSLLDEEEALLDRERNLLKEDGKKISKKEAFRHGIVGPKLNALLWMNTSRANEEESNKI